MDFILEGRFGNSLRLAESDLNSRVLDFHLQLLLNRPMETLSTICKQIDSWLDPATYSDAAFNGLQVESERDKIDTIALAVDSGESIIDKAIQAKAQLLIVHHGIFWGNNSAPITGILSRKLAKLLNNELSLYGSHLPLDGHIEFGNAAGVAKLLHAGIDAPFGIYAGGAVGVRATLSTDHSIEEIKTLLARAPGATQMVSLSFGAQKIRSVAIVTGSGSFAIADAAAHGVDLLISGESKQEAYHLAKEYKQSVLFMGHYASETFGVRSIGDALEKKFSVKTIFIDEPTGI